MGNPFQRLSNIQNTVKSAGQKAMQYKGRTRYGNEDRADLAAQQQAEDARGFKFEQYIAPTRPGDVPITVRYGAKPQPAAPTPPVQSKVPRERWIRSNTAQMQGPLPTGQTPGMVPYIGPYPNATQRVPDMLDPRTKRYTPGSMSEYQAWLTGQAFGSGAANTNTLGLTYEDEQGNIKYLTQGPTFADQAARTRWQQAMDYPDAADRDRTRKTVTTLGGIGGAMARSAEDVYGALAANTKRYADPYAAVENVRLNRGAPSDNLSEAPNQMPAYGGYPDGYGGRGYGGGGGGGGYSPYSKVWFNNLATWRI